MKLYVKDLFSRIKDYSKQLDAETILYNKKWLFMTDNEEQVVYIFRPNNELIVTLNGVGVKGKWEILFDNTISIEVKDEIRIYNAAFVEEKFLALQLDSNHRYDVLVEKTIQEQYSIQSLAESLKYIQDKYNQIEQEIIRKKEEERLKLIQAENERKLRLEQERKASEQEKLLILQRQEAERQRQQAEQEAERQRQEAEGQRKEEEQRLARLEEERLNQVVETEIQYVRITQLEKILTSKPFNIIQMTINNIIFILLLISSTNLQNTYSSFTIQFIGSCTFYWMIFSLLSLVLNMCWIYLFDIVNRNKKIRIKKGLCKVKEVGVIENLNYFKKRYCDNFLIFWIGGAFFLIFCGIVGAIIN